MTVSETALRKLYHGLGVDTVDNWDLQTLTAKTNIGGGIARFFDEKYPIKDEESQKLYDEITAVHGSEIVEITADAAAPETPAAGKGKKGKAAKAAPKAGKGKPPAAKKAAKKKPNTARAPGDVVEKESYADRKKKWKKKYGQTGAPITDRAPVLQAVVRELREAGKAKKPMTKEHILEVLKKEFKSRDPKRMWNYLQNLVPTRLRVENWLHVWKKKLEDGRTGYFIDPKTKGLEEQPAEKGAGK